MAVSQGIFAWLSAWSARLLSAPHAFCCRRSAEGCAAMLASTRSVPPAFAILAWFSAVNASAHKAAHARCCRPSACRCAATADVNVIELLGVYLMYYYSVPNLRLTCGCAAIADMTRSMPPAAAILAWFSVFPARLQSVPHACSSALVSSMEV